MRKIHGKHNVAYTTTARKGAPYTIDGVHHFNGGDLSEICAKGLLGYAAAKDANTSFDKGSDIPELSASVKSAKATLTSMVLGDNFDDVLKIYFERTHSTMWIWSYVNGDEVELYVMDKVEFEEFTKLFASWASDRKVIRYKTTSKKMTEWFEAHI